MDTTTLNTTAARQPLVERFMRALPKEHHQMVDDEVIGTLAMVDAFRASYWELGESDRKAAARATYQKLEKIAEAIDDFNLRVVMEQSKARPSYAEQGHADLAKSKFAHYYGDDKTIAKATARFKGVIESGENTWHWSYRHAEGLVRREKGFLRSILMTRRSWERLATAKATELEQGPVLHLKKAHEATMRAREAKRNIEAYKSMAAVLGQVLAVSNPESIYAASGLAEERRRQQEGLEILRKRNAENDRKRAEAERMKQAHEAAKSAADRENAKAANRHTEEEKRARRRENAAKGRTTGAKTAKKEGPVR